MEKNINLDSRQSRVLSHEFLHASFGLESTKHDVDSLRTESYELIQLGLSEITNFRKAHSEISNISTVGCVYNFLIGGVAGASSIASGLL